MKISSKPLTTVLALLFVAAFGLAGCNEGPIEEAGDDIEDAAEEAQDTVDDAADEVEDAADEVEDEIDG